MHDLPKDNGFCLEEGRSHCSVFGLCSRPYILGLSLLVLLGKGERVNIVFG